MSIENDYQKYNEDEHWDGLKGFLTNSKLPASNIIAHYRCLWYIEKAFRISKTDLCIRSINHRLRQRIEAHICVCFVAYTIYKELERVLVQAKAPFSGQRPIDLTLDRWESTVQLPESGKTTKIMLKLTQEQ